MLCIVMVFPAFGVILEATIITDCTQDIHEVLDLHLQSVTKTRKSREFRQRMRDQVV